MRKRIDPTGLDLSKEVVVQVKRVSKVVKGGKRFGFAALVVVGDGQGCVGVGLGKATDNADAIRKGTEEARKNLIRVPLMGSTIPHTVDSFYGAAHVVLKPAAPGTGVVAGAAVRAVVECAGIDNIITKSIGSANKINIVYSTMNGLSSLFNAGAVARNRGKEVVELVGKKAAAEMEQAANRVQNTTEEAAAE